MVPIIMAVATAATILMRTHTGNDDNLRHHVIECNIFDLEGRILRRFGGWRCVFFPDGSYISGTHKSLTHYSPDSQKIWEHPIETHHSIRPGLNGKEIIVMTSSLHRIKRTTVRFDRVVVYDLAGRERKSFNFFDHAEELRKLAIEPQLYDIPSSMQHWEKNVPFEFAHLNSVYEIGDTDLGRKDLRFAKGNYIMTVLGLGLILVVDSDLKKILWSQNLHDNHGVHDVQLLPNGKLLVYNNFSGANFSSLDEWDPLTGKKRVIFQGNPPQKFFSPSCGGVQALSKGHWLYSDYTDIPSAVEIDGKGRKVRSFPFTQVDAKTGKPQIFQDVKRMDLSDFLKNNKGL